MTANWKKLFNDAINSEQREVVIIVDKRQVTPLLAQFKKIGAIFKKRKRDGFVATKITLEDKVISLKLEKKQLPVYLLRKINQDKEILTYKEKRNGIRRNHKQIQSHNSEKGCI